MMKENKGKKGSGFHLKMKRNFNWITITTTIFVVILSGIILQLDIGNHKQHIDQKNEFLKTEKAYFDRHVNYLFYGVYGFRLFLHQSGSIIFFNNSSSLGDMEASIYYDARMKIGKPQEDGKIYERPTGGGLDFPWIFLLLLAPASLIYGFFAPRNREYIKFLMGFSSWLKTHTEVIFSRLIVLTIVIILIFIEAFIQLALNNIDISEAGFKYLPVFVLATIGIMFFFFLLGAAVGTVNDPRKSIPALILSWLILVHLWPNLLQKTFEKYADKKMESRYTIENSKKKIFSGFESSLFEIARKYGKSPDLLKERILLYEQFWNVDFKKILDIETKNIEQIENITKKFHFLSIFNPVTFYRALCNELSSRGYLSYIDFYKTCLEKYKGFMRFYIDNWVLKKNIKLVPFVEGEEQVFYAEPALPAYFVPGVIIFFGWIVAAYLLSLFGFKRMLRPTQKKKVDFEKIKLDIRAGNYISLQAGKPRYLADQIYAALTGKSHKSFNGKITLDGKKIESLQPVFYLPEPDKLPKDLTIGQLEKLAGLPVTSKDLFKNLELKKQT
ncbi:MAG: ABC transporter permease subunit, partial [Candidatus Aminicenantes bacterium]|nr:ABC transporter permease subunit [Candidatus Aminicenantes bacterium]